jgi:hypothetical protein
LAGVSRAFYVLVRTAALSIPSFRRKPVQGAEDRGKKGSQRYALVDAHGVPLSLIVSGANVHDSKKIGALLDTRVASPADEATTENLCLDAGYVGKAVEVAARGYPM